MEIRTSIVWNTDKNIGVSYNKEMESLPSDDDFRCFIDGDACFTTDFWGKQLEDIVSKYKNCGCFVGVTNRIGCLWQRVEGVDWDNNDMAYHRKVGNIMFDTRYTDITDVSNVPKGEVQGGVLILLKKSVWKRVGGFKENGILGIDNDLHWKLQDHNEPVYMMNGVYVYHWYRGGYMTNKKHLL